MKNAIVIVGALIAAGAAMSAAMLPEIKRYLKMRAM
jgi:hypothetical protein